MTPALLWPHLPWALGQWTAAHNGVLLAVVLALVVTLVYFFLRGRRTYEETSRRLSIDALDDRDRYPYVQLGPDFVVRAQGGDLEGSGYGPGTLRGAPVWDVIPEDSAPGRDLRAAMDHRRSREFTLDLPPERTRTGRRRVLVCKASPTTDGGLLVRGVNVTELVEAKERAEREAGRLRDHLADALAAQRAVAKILPGGALPGRISGAPGPDGPQP